MATSWRMSTIQSPKRSRMRDFQVLIEISPSDLGTYRLISSVLPFFLLLMMWDHLFLTRAHFDRKFRYNPRGCGVVPYERRNGRPSHVRHGYARIYSLWVAQRYSPLSAHDAIHISKNTSIEGFHTKPSIPIDEGINLSAYVWDLHCEVGRKDVAASQIQLSMMGFDRFWLIADLEKKVASGVYFGDLRRGVGRRGWSRSWRRQAWTYIGEIHCV